MTRRPDISMSPDEIHAFLTSADGAILVANSLDGGTTAAVAPFELRGQTVVLSMRPDDAMMASLRTDDRVCVTVERYPSYREIRAVIVHGKATIIESPTSAESVEVHLPLGDDIVSFDFSKTPLPSDGSALL